MRGTIGKRLANTAAATTTTTTNYYSCTKQTLTHFSTFSGSGRGRGRGGGASGDAPDFSKPQFIPPPPGKPGVEDAAFPLSGAGHGRGKPFTQPTPSFTNPWNQQGVVQPSIGRGRTTQTPLPPPPSPSPSPQEDGESQSEKPKMPIFFRREDAPQEEGIRPPSFLPDLPGIGRGKPMAVLGEKPVEVNRHLRPRVPNRAFEDRSPTPEVESPQEEGSQRKPKLSREEATRMALGVLSRQEGGRGGGGGAGGRGVGGRGFSARGGRGRGRGRGRGGRGGRGSRDSEDGPESGLYLGDDADGERLAERLGPEKMAMLTEAFDEISYKVLPSPGEDAYLDALHTNMMIEYEPEYSVEFDNPDIDEKPPIPLRDHLEKMKPFLMAYEGIQSQEEWEEIIEELMGRVPQMKELIDYYCGPDRVTAKQQQQELERVAKTIPDNVPPSVKLYTERAVLSLQSNPGWGWDKKCQFMDKLVWEVSQLYK